MQSEHFQQVTTREQSERLLAAGLSQYSADAYLQLYLQDGEYRPALVPMGERQLELDEYDRFFRVNRADVSRANIIPAWTLSRLWQICGAGTNLMPGDDAFEELVKRIVFLLPMGDIDESFIKHDRK